MPKKPTLSASKLDMLYRCGVQYYYRYVINEIKPPAVALPIGISVHKSAEVNLRKWIETGSYISQDEAMNIAADTMSAEWNKGVMLSQDEVALGVPKVKGMAIDRSVKMAQCHYRDVAPYLQPIQIEVFGQIKLEHYPFDISYKIDVEEPLHIRDLKAGGKARSQADVDSSIQLSIYTMAFLNKYKRWPTYVAIDSVSMSDKGVGAKYTPLISVRGQDHIDAAMQRIDKAAELIEREIYIPANSDSWTCSPKWCGYWDQCPYAHRSERPQS